MSSVARPAVLLQLVLAAILTSPLWAVSAAAGPEDTAKEKLCWAGAEATRARDQKQAAEWVCGGIPAPPVRDLAELYRDCVTGQGGSTERETLRRNDDATVCRRCADALSIAGGQFNEALTCRRAVAGPAWIVRREPEFWARCVLGPRIGEPGHLAFNEDIRWETEARAKDLSYCRRGSPAEGPGPAAAPQLACGRYAENAKAMAARAAASACGLTGPRYAAEFDAHFNWCLTAKPEWVASETTLRTNEVQACERCRRYSDDAEIARAEASKCIVRAGRLLGAHWEKTREENFISCIAVSTLSYSARGPLIEDERAREAAAQACRAR